MRIVFENKSTDTNAVLYINNTVNTVMPQLSFDCDIDGETAEFSVVYDRDFYIETDEKTNKITKLFFDNIGNLIVQIKNTYRVSGLADGDVIQLFEKAHYVPTTKLEQAFNCVPALYYFVQAECEKGKIDVESSFAINHEEFIKTYKAIFRVFNLSGTFRILRYSKQMKRQKKISSDSVLTKKFQELYSLPFEDREYQFKPLLVIFDRVIESILKKIPKKLRVKLQSKLDEFRDLLKE